MRCVYSFMVGQLIYAARRRLTSLILPAASVVELGTIALVTLFVTAAERSALSYAAPLVFADATFVFSYVQGAVSRLLLRPSFQHSGETSYSIYMVHAFVWFVLGMAVSVAGRATGVDPWQIMWDDGMSRRVLMLDSKLLLDLLLVAYLACVHLLATLTQALRRRPRPEHVCAPCGPLGPAVAKAGPDATAREPQRPVIKPIRPAVRG